MPVHRFVSHNGQIREVGEGMLSPGQLGLLAGWGIFSTLRVSEGVLFAWERHWARLTRDAALLNIALPDSEDVKRDLEALIEANHAHDSTLRLVFIRNAGGMWEGPPTGHDTDVVALTANRNKWGESVRLTYQPGGRFAGSDFAHAKVNSWAQNLRWYERAHDAGFDECILLNQHGEITECTSANIFAVQGSDVWTAPVEAGCLPGITREILLTEIRVPGIRIGERRLRPEDLESADDVFITSSTRDLLPVAEIGSHETGTKTLAGKPEVRNELLVEFRRYLQGYVESRAKKIQAAV
jgi:branched-chain amino acid aminotransferase